MSNIFCLKTCIYITCNLLSLSMAFLKILVLLAHKEDFFRLILYLQERFLYADYNDYEKKIIIGCKRKCIFFVSFLTFSIMATLGAYVLKPIIGKSFYKYYVERKSNYNLSKNGDLFNFME